MKRDAVLRGYEDSASGSEDESAAKRITRVARDRPNRRKPVRSRAGTSSYSIKPVERSSGQRVSQGSSEDVVDEASGSDEDVEDLMSSENNIRIDSPPKRNRKSSRKYKKNQTVKDTNPMDEYSFNTVFVVDYDMTLVDRNARPFPGAKKFLRDLYLFNNSRSTLVLYSHASSGHIQRGLSTHFRQEIDVFSETITDHTMSKNKPVTQVRRVLSNMSDLSGPIVIIDDCRSNLDDDQYDVTIDVSRHFIRDKFTNEVVDIDYDTIRCLLTEGISNWLKTKSKRTALKHDVIELSKKAGSNSWWLKRM